MQTMNKTVIRHGPTANACQQGISFKREITLEILDRRMIQQADYFPIGIGFLCSYNLNRYPCQYSPGLTSHLVTADEDITFKESMSTINQTRREQKMQFKNLIVFPT